MPTLRVIIELVGFQVVWLACAFGASQGLAWPGVVAAICVVCTQVARSASWRRALALVVGVGIMGAGIESGLVRAGFILYNADWPGNDLAPVWTVALWAAFATILNAMRAVLGENPYLKAFVVGALIGPVSYFSASRLGALTLGEPVLITCLWLSGVWAVAFPLCLYLAERMFAPIARE